MQGFSGFASRFASTLQSVWIHFASYSQGFAESFLFFHRSSFSRERRELILLFKVSKKLCLSPMISPYCFSSRPIKISAIICLVMSGLRVRELFAPRIKILFLSKTSTISLYSLREIAKVSITSDRTKSSCSNIYPTNSTTATPQIFAQSCFFPFSLSISRTCSKTTGSPIKTKSTMIVFGMIKFPICTIIPTISPTVSGKAHISPTINDQKMTRKSLIVGYIPSFST